MNPPKSMKPLVALVVGTFALSNSIRADEQSHADGESSSARFNQPQNVAVGKDGEVFVADTKNHVIRKISPDGTVSTVAGTPGIAGYSDGPGEEAKFNSPWGLAVSKEGEIFVSDSKNNVIRKISRDGSVSTLAGDPEERGSADGQGKAAKFIFPNGSCLDSQGNLLVIDETPALRRVTPEGNVKTLPKSIVQFGNPVDVAVGAEGTIYVIERQGIIIKIDGKVATVVIGKEDSPWSSDRLDTPSAFAISPDGSLLVSEAKSTDKPTITRIPPTEVASVFAGGGTAHRVYHIGTGPDAVFSRMGGIAVAEDGTAFVADVFNNVIRKIDSKGVVRTLAGRAPQ